jgi:hypothetical protein
MAVVFSETAAVFSETAAVFSETAAVFIAQHSRRFPPQAVRCPRAATSPAV